MKKKKLNNDLILVIALMLTTIAILTVMILDRGQQLKPSFVSKSTGTAVRQVHTAAGEANAATEAKIASHVYSHRGSAGPEEHSFKAYDEAIDAGSRYIEQDLVISSDGILYVSHDLNAVSMTGYDGMYEYMSSETIDGLETKAGNKVLRLSEVFDKYGRDINYVIELKDGSDACIRAFEDMVDSYGLSDMITVQSVDPGVLQELESKYPDMPKLLVCRSQGDFESALDKPYIDIISVKEAAALMTESNCSAAHEHDKLFSAWTLDSEESIKYAIEMGVDTYFTNDTPLALSLEREYGIIEGMRRGRE